MNDKYERDHTLGATNDPLGLHSLDAYIEEGDGKVRVNPSATVLVTDVRSCIVRSPDGEPGIAFQLSGISGKDRTEVSITHVSSLHGVAQMVGHLIEVAVSSGEENANFFRSVMQKEMDRQIKNHMGGSDGDEGGQDDLEAS